jgi:RND family efflux transporter MFP subunit
MSPAADYADEAITTDSERVSQARTGARVSCCRSGQPRALLSRRFFVEALLLAIVGAMFVHFFTPRDLAPAAGPELVYYTVQRGEPLSQVTQRGSLESQHNVPVLCEVNDVPGDAIIGTPILWIIPNGSTVQQGDLLVELDAGPHQERLDLQIMNVQRARAGQLQAQIKYDNQQTQNRTASAEAEHKVRLAEVELEMFQDEENGTYRLEVRELERLIEDVNNDVHAAYASMELKRNEKRGIESLFKLGYAGKRQLDRVRLEFLQAEAKYAAKMNYLDTQLATLAKKRTYERQMRLLQFQGRLESARRRHSQVERDNEALLAQARSALDAANELLKKEEERLDRYREQVAKCNIYAPDDGTVAYAVPANTSPHEAIRAGAVVRPRQPILFLPNLEQMQVKTSVEETMLDRIRAGLPVTVRVDAFPERVYPGTVQSVDMTPTQAAHGDPNKKVCETLVTIDQEVEDLRPGMTAAVDIHTEQLRPVLRVPLQAVVRAETDTWCYLQKAGSLQRRSVKLGRANGKLVEVETGLREGDRVVLNPTAIRDDATPGTPAPDPRAPLRNLATDEPETAGSGEAWRLGA